jgi:hypothetical protein
MRRHLLRESLLWHKLNEGLVRFSMSARSSGLPWAVGECDLQTDARALQLYSARAGSSHAGDLETRLQ